MKTRILLVVVAVAAAVLMSQPSPREQVGPMADGGFLLSSGWRIKAAGTRYRSRRFRWLRSRRRTINTCWF